MRDAPSRTAEIVCFMRAAEAREPERHRILYDRYAQLFLRPLSRASLATWRIAGSVNRWAGDLSPGMAAFVLARHRFIDEAMIEAVGRGSIRQVVLLGAGYDTRAYRFAGQLRDTRIFEVDHPATGGRKRTVTAANTELLVDPGNLSYVEIDFRVDSLSEKLRAAGFDPAVPAFFVWEGVSMYLTREQVKNTLQTLHALGASGSELALDFWFLMDGSNLYSTVHRTAAQMLSFLSEPITFTLHPEDAPSMLERLGWRAEDVATASELERRFVTDERKVSPANYVLTATRI